MENEVFQDLRASEACILLANRIKDFSQLLPAKQRLRLIGANEGRECSVGAHQKRI